MSALKEFFGFKFFYPSSEAVSIKAAPSLEEDINIKSAGNISSAVVSTMSPTTTLLQLTY